MQITHDFHTHSFYSGDASPAGTFERYIERAKNLGITHLGFAEHFWDESIEGVLPFYRPLTREYMMKAKRELDGYKKTEDIHLFFGCEVEYDPVHKAPAITEETAQMFDYVIVPHSHSHETMPKEYYNDYKKHCDFLLEAYENIINSNVSSYIVSMAHPFALVRCPYPAKTLIDLISDDTFKRIFDQTANKGIAVEINTSCTFKNLTLDTLEQSPHLRMFKLAKECGCKFLFGSDSHGPDSMDILEKANAISTFLMLKKEDIASIAH